MHIDYFKNFSDLVESKSFSKAAKLNGITQSAVSQQLRSMEKHFDILIVDRSQKQFRLTCEGEKLYESAKEILYLYDKLISELQEMKKVISGTIHLSTVFSIGLHELQPYVKDFMQEYPEVTIRTQYRRSNLVYEDVIHNTSDLGLVAYPTASRQLDIIPFLEDLLVVICSPTHELASKGEVTVKDLANYPMIGFEKDIPTRKAIDKLFKDSGVENEPVMDCDNIEIVKRAVEIDQGFAIVPSVTVRQEVQLGTLKRVDLEGKSLRRPLGIIIRKGRVLSPAMKRFIDLLTSKQLIEES